MESTTRDGRFVGLNDLAEELGVQPATIRRWFKEAGVPSYRLGGLIRFRRDDVDRFIEQSQEIDHVERDDLDEEDEDEEDEEDLDDEDEEADDEDEDDYAL
ncbi:MAG: helix-turn-helix domain-containing protein [Planctomycetes bacterium]|nr:helix-turn-helix domain-containing protein [Planctomycetota bacterium]